MTVHSYVDVHDFTRMQAEIIRHEDGSAWLRIEVRSLDHNDEETRWQRIATIFPPDGVPTEYIEALAKAINSVNPVKQNAGKAA